MRKKEKFQVVDMVKTKVRMTNVNNWKTKDIIKCLRQIERQDGFTGFTRINFEVNELPEITYLTRLLAK